MFAHKVLARMFKIILKQQLAIISILITDDPFSNTDDPFSNTDVSCFVCYCQLFMTLQNLILRAQ